MLRTSNRISDTVQSSQGLGDNLRQIGIQFWRFSNFYGDYQSLPPAKRRQFALDRQTQHK
ncbi:MAG: hypothetical protein WBG32_11020 [Nodosilinea sp.]